MKLMRTAILLMVVGWAAACGTIAPPVWEVTPTSVAALPGGEGQGVNLSTLQARPTDTPVPSSTPLPTDTPAPTAVPATNTPLPLVVQPTATPATGAGASSGGQLDVLVDLYGNAQNGQVLFTTYYEQAGFACATCHNVQGDAILIGPSLYGIRDRAATRVAGLSVADYIYASILHPKDYIVERWNDQTAIMPQVYRDVYTDQELYDIIAYLLTLHD